MKVAVVGATGLVGGMIVKVLEERNFPVTQFIPAASPKSAGKKVRFKGKDFRVVTVEEAIALRPQLALFSAGSETSLAQAPVFSEAGAVVVDNSSAWRMDPNKKLVVPEVNGNSLTIGDRIIANPNCSTIQMVVALKPLHDAYKIKRIVVSTYQSVTGTGARALNQLLKERAGEECGKVYPYQIDMNVIPQIDDFTENGYTREEMKLVNETVKIMGDPNIKVTATTVRIPVIGGHSESVNVEFERDFELEEVRRKLDRALGVTVVDDTGNLQYPMPLHAHNKDDVFVGRLRRDETQARTLNMWIVSDNLRKGAATNTVQIAEYLIKKGMI